MLRLASTTALVSLALLATACAKTGDTQPTDAPTAADTPADTPAADAPADDTAADTPVADAPAADEPVADAPVVDEPAPDAPALTRSAAPAIGEAPPDFTLADLDGNEHSLSDFVGKTVVLEWLNHDCPYVLKHYDVGNMQALQKAAKDDGVVWLSICSSAPGKQGHFSTDEFKARQKKEGAMPTAVLPDPTGTVGKLYQAKRTPTMFVIGPDGKLAYMGAIDDAPRARGDDIKGALNYVTEALAAVKANKMPEVTTTKAYG